jgi:electron transport complex protein RnfG
MDFKKSLKDVLVLVIICAVFATVLAAVNSVTAPIIADRLEQAANEAYFSVMEGATGFETVDLSQYTLPKTVKEAKKEKSGMGYAIKLETKGYASGMIIIVGVSNEGVVTGATCIASNETWGLEGGMGDKVVGSDINSIVDVEAGATSLTVNAYRAAVKDAINTATILGGGSVDIRTEEEKFQDALEAALPEGGEEFTKVVLLSAIEGIDSVYEAVNGKGYVCVIGTDSTGIFLGVDADGKAVGEMSAEHKALAEAAIASVKANVTVDVDLTPYMDNSLIANYVNSVKKTGAGTFVIEIKTSGNYTADTPIVVMVVIDAEGKIVDAQTVSHAETDNIGGTHLQDGKFNASFIGKNEEEAGGVNIVAGVTFTTTAYKNAILNAFSVVKILGGEEVDTRTEEEKFADALDAALPAGDGEFTKMFMVEIVEGFDAIYEATNGAGYVCVIGTDSTGTFIGVGSDGVALGDNENNALAEAAVAIVSATEFTDVDLSAYEGIHENIVSIKKTATGNYVVEVKGEGYGKKGKYGASGKYMYINVSFSADGTVIDSQTISHGETPNPGGAQLEDGAYNSNFFGKTEAECDELDTVAGATITTEGYKNAILNAFTAIEIIEGGTN